MPRCGKNNVSITIDNNNKEQAWTKSVKNLALSYPQDNNHADLAPE